MVGSDRKGRGVDAPAPAGLAASTASSSTLRAAFLRHGSRTALDRVYEAGALRLRQPRGAACEAILVNTGGGIVGGDRLTLDVALGVDTEVTVTNVAAEKVYGAAETAAATSTIDTRLQIAAGATLDWLPQETILFDGARLDRRFDIEMAADARLVASELLIFGRLARGETAITGTSRDRWRVRRDGRLVFADESRIDGAIGARLDRPAIGGGARSAALLLVVAPRCGAASRSGAHGPGAVSRQRRRRGRQRVGRASRGTAALAISRDSAGGPDRRAGRDPHQAVAAQLELTTRRRCAPTAKPPRAARWIASQIVMLHQRRHPGLAEPNPHAVPH